MNQLSISNGEQFVFGDWIHSITQYSVLVKEEVKKALLFPPGILKRENKHEKNEQIFE